MKRCAWAKSELEIQYHDHEWGKVSLDERYLFEMLVLEMMQAGLSWRTILEKREAYRQLFYNFDVHKIVNMPKFEREALYQDSRIIRNRLKIDAIFHNAKLIVENDLSLVTLFWSYLNGLPLINDVRDAQDMPSQSELSKRIAQDLKKMGFKFVGPTIIYSYMHAIGMVDDHENECSFKTKQL